MNKTTFTGNLGADPEIHYRDDGVAVTTFPVAANHPLPEGEDLTWFHVTVWGNLAEKCYQDLVKGDRVYVEGRLQSTLDGSPRVFKYRGEWRAKFEIKGKFVEYQRARRL